MIRDRPGRRRRGDVIPVCAHGARVGHDNREILEPAEPHEAPRLLGIGQQPRCRCSRIGEPDGFARRRAPHVSQPLRAVDVLDAHQGVEVRRQGLILDDDISTFQQDGLDRKCAGSVVVLHVAPLDHEVPVGRCAARGVVDRAVIIRSADEQILPERRNKVVRDPVVGEGDPARAIFRAPLAEGDQAVGVEVELGLAHTVERKAKADVHRAAKCVVAGETALGRGAHPAVGEQVRVGIAEGIRAAGAFCSRLRFRYRRAGLPGGILISLNALGRQGPQEILVSQETRLVTWAARPAPRRLRLGLRCAGGRQEQAAHGEYRDENCQFVLHCILLASMCGDGLISQRAGRGGEWKVTPAGRRGRES